MPEEHTPDGAQREQRMRDWLASLPPAERESLDDTLAGASAEDVDAIAERIGAALKQLPEEQRMAVFLCDFGGLSYHEAASQLHISARVVQQRVESGRRTLELFLPRELLEDAQRLNQREGHGSKD